MVTTDTDMPEAEKSVESLVGEFKQLRGEFAKIAARLDQTARTAGAEAAQRARAAGDRVWAGTQATADQVSERIKEQPLASAGVAFGVGVLLGIILARR